MGRLRANLKGIKRGVAAAVATLAGRAYIKRKQPSGGKHRVSKKTGSKTPHRLGRSFTVTKTKKDTPNEASDMHSGLSSKKFTVVLHAKAPAHQKASWKYCQTNTALSKVGAGVQGLVVVCAANTNAQQMTSTGVGYSVTQSSVSLQDQNPYATNTGGWYTSSTRPATDRFFIKTIRIRTEINNASNIATGVDVYYLKCKQPGQSDPIAIWTSGNLAMGLGEATQVIPVRGGAAAVAGYAIPNEPWSIPTESTQFREYYKVLKHIKLDMAAASNEFINGTFVMNTIVKAEESNKQIADALPFNKNTIFVLVVSRGAVCKDTISLSPVYGPSEILAISQTYYECHSVDGNAGRLNASTHVTQAAIEGTAANVNYVNIVDNVAAIANVIL